ncbi:MAG: hypothetical protein H0X41_00265 [Chitinophagaceae bacterium]|nr:hypothetical protein [Chitinophagaceae bacterium]
MKLNYRWSFLMIIFATQTLHAQKGLNSIYSAYGIGNYNMRDQNANTGMGNVGVALPSQGTLNETNPASFAWLPKNKFMFEVSFDGLSTKYMTTDVNISAGDFTISRVALGFQLVKPLWTVFGLRKFSSVDYLTTNTHDIAGTNSGYVSTIEGNGGLYQVYMANSIKIQKHLTLGLTTGFVFGSINSTETIGAGTDILIEDNNKYYNHGTINAGAQYQFNAGKNNFMIGAFYEPQIALNVLEQNNLQNRSGGILVQREDKSYTFSFPQKYGAGLTWKKNAFTVSADAIIHSWSATGYKGNNFSTTDAASYSVGVRHQPNKQGVFGTVPGIGLYAGFNFENAYLVVDNYQLQSKSFSIGASFPSKNTLNTYAIGLKVGTRGEAVYPLVKENFIQFNFTLSLGSYFLKGPRYD